MSKWQPIEAAPKDGTQFLAFARGERGMTFFGVAQWVEADPDVNQGISAAELKLWWWPFAIQPTHWMPLPDAPKVA